MFKGPSILLTKYEFQDIFRYFFCRSPKEKFVFSSSDTSHWLWLVKLSHGWLCEQPAQLLFCFVFLFIYYTQLAYPSGYSSHMSALSHLESVLEFDFLFHSVFFIWSGRFSHCIEGSTTNCDAFDVGVRWLVGATSALIHFSHKFHKVFPHVHWVVMLLLLQSADCDAATVPTSVLMSELLCYVLNNTAPTQAGRQ